MEHSEAALKVLIDTTAEVTGLLLMHPLDLKLHANANRSVVDTKLEVVFDGQT